MAGISSRVDSALEELQWEFRTGELRFSESFVILSLARDRISVFKFELGFLTFYLDSIKKWSDAVEVVPDLGSFAIKIQDSIRDTLRPLWFLVDQRPKAPKSKSLFSVFKRKNKLEVMASEKKSFEEWVSKVVDVILNSIAVVENLKQEIRGFYDTFSSHSIQCRSPMQDYEQWKKFVLSIISNLQVLKQTEFCEKLKLVRIFTDHVAGSFSENPKIEDYKIHVASVALRAALLSCECWVRNKDLEISEEMTLTLLNLQTKIDLANPEFVDMNLRLLRTSRSISDHSTYNNLSRFIEYIFSFRLVFIRLYKKKWILHALTRGILFLITDAFSKWEKNAEDALRILEDVKALIIEIGSLPPIGSLPSSSLDGFDKDLLAGEHRIPLLNLLAKIWLIHMENFLRKEIRERDITLLSVEEQSDIDDEGLRDLNLEDAMRFLRPVLDDPEEENIENLKQIVTLMEGVAKAVASPKYTSTGKIMTMKMVRNFLFKYLVKVMLIKGELSLIQLLNNKEIFVLVKDQIESLNWRFTILKMFMKNQPVDGTEDGIMIFTRIEAFARGIFFCYSFSSCKMTEDMIKNMNLLLHDLLEQIKLIIVGLKEIYLHVPRSNFSKRIGLGFMDSLLRNLRDLLSNKADLITFVKLQIEGIMLDLDFLRSFLKDILQKDVEEQELKEVGACSIEVVQEMEYFIDSMVLGNGVDWHICLWVYHLSEDIRIIKTRIEKAYEKKAHDAGVSNVPQISIDKELQGSTTNIEEAVVGLNDQQEMILDRLTRGSLQLNIIPIVGMPGIGKTTLAKKLYSHPRVVYHFHVRAWCHVSQTFRKRELLLSILSHITVLTNEILGMSDEDLDLKLYQHLKQKRYLIVMDDMWNSKAWHELEKSLPNDGNGSRILLTSRLHDVVLRAQPDCNPHSLRLLSDVESWELLQKKIFHSDDCPEELVGIGKKIAKNCKGLPLAIVAIAGLLERTEKQLVWWNEIAESLSSRILDDPEMQCMNILELSYMHLPDYLKSCFLYFGAFQEDEYIPVQKLIQLWIAEGFIPRYESKSLEDLAEDYLMDLIVRNLVMVAEQRSKGGVKSCCIHDMLRSLCLLKAKEENFLRQIMVSEKAYASFDGLDYGVDFDYSYPSACVTYEDQRLSISSKRKHFVMSRPSGAHARSVLFFATSDMYPRCPYDLSFISDNFKLLRVLDLQCINMGVSFPGGLGLLIHLRYLATCGDIDSVPSSIANLWNLETLIVKGLKGKVQLPDTIWSMARLRHVHVSTHALFNLKDGKLGNSSPLENLVTLSSPFLCHGENTNNILRQFPNLRKLRCIFSESWNGSQNCNHFPGLDILTQLESLKMSLYGRAFHPVEFCLPLNLKKLTLSNFHLPWSHISMIGSLQNLEVLKLLSRAFDGELWDMVEGEFSRLKFLKLEALNIVKWNACCDHLPNLQHLVLRRCQDLEEIPCSFLEIPTLHTIEIQWCGDSAEESARRIREEADEGLNVFINLADSEIKSS